MTLEELREWAERALDDGNLDSWGYALWKKQGKRICRNCHKPVYCDNGPGNSSGYWFHVDTQASDKQNGLYCYPEGWTTGSTGAAPTDPIAEIEDVARAVLELIHPAQGVGS